MDFDALRAFVSVVDTGSLVAASRQLKLARATLRRRVDELEARAGVTLLHRTSKGITATEAGEVLARRGRVVLEEASALLTHVREVGAELSGQLRLVMPVGLPPQFLIPLVKVLRAKHPKLSVRMRFADDPVAGLLDDVDVALHFGKRSPDGPFTSFELIRVREWLIASEGYLARAGKPRSVDDLAKHDLLSWDAPDADPRLLPTTRGTAFAIDPRLVCSDIHFLRRCAAAGMGIAFVPDARIPEARAPQPHERLVPVLPETVGRERSVRVVVPSALLDIPRIRVVLDEIRSLARRPRRMKGDARE